jgi:hypothetical protein
MGLHMWRRSVLKDCLLVCSPQQVNTSTRTIFNNDQPLNPGESMADKVHHSVAWFDTNSRTYWEGCLIKHGRVVAGTLRA